MSYARDAFVDKIHEIYTKKKVLAELTAQRLLDEQALVVEYKVDECNAKRAKLMKDAQVYISPVIEEINVLEKELLEI